MLNFGSGYAARDINVEYEVGLYEGEPLALDTRESMLSLRGGRGLVRGVLAREVVVYLHGGQFFQVEAIKKKVERKSWGDYYQVTMTRPF